MTEPEPSNHWKSLAEDLGANPSDADADAEPQPPVHPDPETPPQPKPRKRRAADAVSSPTSDWGGLAKELGVTDEEGADAHVEPAATDSAGEVAPPPDSRPIPDDVLDEDTVAAAVTRVVEEVAEENIDFGDADTDTEGDGNRAADATDADTEAADAAERPTRRRRRRRPRRRSGRSKASTDDTSENSAEASGPVADSEATSDEAVVAEVASEAVDADDDDDGDDSDDSSKPSRPSHRNIPTWDEAIGVIVDANIEARSSRPKAARAGGSRGRGRGRSRGRKR